MYMLPKKYSRSDYTAPAEAKKRLALCYSLLLYSNSDAMCYMTKYSNEITLHYTCSGVGHGLYMQLTRLVCLLGK